MPTTRKPRTRSTTQPRSRSPRSAGVAQRPDLEPFTVEHFVAWAGGIVLDNGLPWDVKPFQRQILTDVFDLKPEVWAVVPEGSGKSTMLAGLALYYGDHIPGAQVLLAAAARHQAKIMLRQAAGMVLASPALAGRYECLDRNIKCLRTGGSLELHAADDNTGDGVLPDFAVVDEPHRLRDLRLYRTWRGKLQKRQGQIMAISTAGEPGSEFEQVRQRLRSDASARMDGRCHLRAEAGGMVLHDWSVPSGEDVWDLDLVLEANPLATREALEQKRDAPTMTEAHWRRMVCNQAVRAETSAVSEREWLQARAAEPEPHEAAAAVGLDVGWKWDTTALVPVFERPDHLLLGEPTVLEPPRDGTSLSPDAIRAALEVLHHAHPYELLVLDGAAGGEQLAEWAEVELGVTVVVHSNGNAAQALAYRRFMEGLRERTLRHVGDPTLTQHVLNATAKMLPLGDHRFVRPASSRSADLQDRRVIDCLSAASAAVSVLRGMESDVPDTPTRAVFL